MTAGRLSFEVFGSISDAEAWVLRAGVLETELLIPAAVADAAGAESHGRGGEIFLGWDGSG